MVTDEPSWRVAITPTAEKELKRLPARDRGRVRAALDALSGGPGRGDLKRIRGRDEEWRLRVGEWRIRFRLDFGARTFVILRVLPRGSAYRN